MDRVDSMCPVVRDEVLHLFERVEVGGKERFLPFDQRVLWIRKSETQIVLRWDGQTLDEKSTLNDFYGYLDLRITDTAVLECTDSEAREDAERYKGQQYRKKYWATPSYHNGKKWWYTSETPDPPPPGADPRTEPLFDRYPRFEAESVYHEQQAAWSSKRFPVAAILPVEIADWIAAERRKAVEKGPS